MIDVLRTALLTIYMPLCNNTQTWFMMLKVTNDRCTQDSPPHHIPALFHCINQMWFMLLLKVRFTQDSPPTHIHPLSIFSYQICFVLLKISNDLQACIVHTKDYCYIQIFFTENSSEVFWSVLINFQLQFSFMYISYYYIYDIYIYIIL